MTNVNYKTYELKVEKIILKPATDVFRAIGEGRLFNNCSADHESLQIDFRVGGQYLIQFIAHNMKNTGEFLEIVPYEKIVFTWCQDYDSNPIPDTKVVIELKDLGGKTALKLTHSGFTDAENRDAHEGGWSGGLDDLSQEMTIGTLRFSRKISMPVDRLINFCQQASVFSEIVPILENKKLNYDFKEIDSKQKKWTVQWKSASGDLISDLGSAMLKFEADDDDQNVSWIELVHEGLKGERQQKQCRIEWDGFFKKVNIRK